VFHKLDLAGHVINIERQNGGYWKKRYWSGKFAMTNIFRHVKPKNQMNSMKLNIGNWRLLSASHKLCKLNST